MFYMCVYMYIYMHIYIYIHTHAHYIYIYVIIYHKYSLLVGSVTSRLSCVRVASVCPWGLPQHACRE